jgi:glycosyltransferase involved in cell wall biosynthesis
MDGREFVAGARTGIGRYIREILRAISQVGWECIVYGDRTTQLEAMLSGVRLRVLDNGWTPWWDQISLPRQLARDRVSVYLSPYYKGPLLAPCPVVLTIHDLFFIGYPGRPRPYYDAAVTRLARCYASRAAAVITDSEYSKRVIMERLDVLETKVTVIPVALGAEFRPQPLSDAIRHRYGITGPYILHVGNFKPHKNLVRLMQAYAALPETLQKTFRLVLAGGDRDHRPALERQARSLGVDGRVLFPGFIEDENLPAIYSGCALFILPSLEEGFGLPALEAMACGAPVAASNRAAVPEVVGQAAVFFDPEDVASIVAAMGRILSQDELRERLRQQGLRRAGEFTVERTAGRVLALLREVSRVR